MTRQNAVQTQQQAASASPLSRGGILQRQCEGCGQHTIAGGECGDCGKKKIGLQRKLTIGASNDPLELEADRVADQVMSAPANSAISHSSPRIQRFTGQASGQTDMVAPASVDRVLSSPGRPLDSALQQDMGQRFGHDFSRVRIHTDGAAARSAREVNANAYTVGNNIVFGGGQFEPGTHRGRRLVAHELTHVVQQSGVGSSPGINGDQEFKNETNCAAHEVVQGKGIVSAREVSDIKIARDAKPSEEILYEVKFPDGTKRLTATEFEAKKQEAIDRLRSRLQHVAALAEVGRNSQINMLKEYQGGVESVWDVINKPKALFGIAADISAGVSPPTLEMWLRVKSTSQDGLSALGRGDILEGVCRLRRADQIYRDSMHEWNAYRFATIGGAEAVESNLETVRDVSFAIALVAGAVVAAPVVAGAVGAGGVSVGGISLSGLGLTGASATVATAVGTAGATGVLGGGLGGGSTALASYTSTGKVDWKATARDAKKFGKQGAVTGFTAGFGSVLGASGKAAELAKPFVQQALKRCLTEAGVNVAGEVTTAALDKVLPDAPTVLPVEGRSEQAPQHQALLPGPVRTVLTGCVGGVLGVPINKLGNGATRKGTDLLVGAGVSYADARLSGQDNKTALAAAAQSTLTAGLIQHAEHPRPTANKNKKSPTQPHDNPTKVTEPPSHSMTLGTDETAKPPISETVAGKVKGSTVENLAPAILKEDAIAKKPTVDGHEAVVTKQGVAKCSPSPCPLIHIQYAEELAKSPKLKRKNDEIQAMRNTNPTKAAEEAASLIRTLEAARSNATKSVSGQNTGTETSFDLHVGEKRAEQIRSGEKNFPLDRALTFDIDEVLPVGAADIKPQRAAARALDSYNRQLLDPNTNQRTKGLGIDVRELRKHRGEHKPVSVTSNPEALISRRFSEVHELKRIFDRAVASVKEPQKLKPTELKARINKEMRRIITEDKGPDAVAVREALATLGFEHQPGRGFTMMKEPP